MMHPLKEKLKALALALAVAAPMSYVLQISMGIWLPAWYVVLFATLSLLLIELIAWNKITAISIPAGAAALCLLLWWLFTKEQREYFSNFYWWAIGFLYDGGDYPLGFGASLTAIGTFLVSLFMWLFGRKFFCFPVVLTAVVAAVLLKWFHGLDAVLVPGILAVGGVILLWAKAMQRRTARQTGQKLNENSIPLLLLPVVLALVLLSVWFVPAEQAAKWQNRQVYDIFERFNNSLADYTDFNRPRHSFSIGSYGFMPMGTRLGGPTKLSDEEVLLVTASRPMLLRGVVYNDYDGKRWQDTTNSEPYRFGGNNKALSDDAFDLVRPTLPDAEGSRFRSFVSDETVLVDPLIDGPSSLFVPYRGITGITSGKFLAVRPRFNAKGEAFNSSDVHAGYDYTIAAEYLDYKKQGFDTMIEDLLALGLTDSTAQASKIFQSYSSLPGGIEQGVYDITNAITNGMTSNWSKAVAIRDFLTKDFSYTLSPSTPPENSDFVSWFILHDRQGYCTYYASAMAVMARIAGIPARYCEGYLMPNTMESGQYYTVRGTNAHAWAELYFEGIGWIPFDATPSSALPDSDGIGNGGNINPIPTPTRPPVTEDQGDTGNLPERNPLTWDDIAPYLWLLPAAAAALALVWVIAMMVRARVRISPRHVARRFGGDHRRGSAFYYFEDLKLLEYYNYPIKQGETPAAYAARIDRWLRLETGRFTEVAELISRISYSDYAPTGNDLNFMARLNRDLTRYTYHTVGPWFYLLHRVLGFKQRVNPRKDR